MSDLLKLTGIVLLAAPAGEYDKRVVILTKECGKITAFAKGVRRQNSPLLAAASPFAFGEFSCYEGRGTYRLVQAEIQQYFREITEDYESAMYGFYFLELADYFGREGTDEKEMMNLLYVTVKALMNQQLDNRLIRCIYELRTMVEQGLCPQLFQCTGCEKEISDGEDCFFSQEMHGILCISCALGKRDARRISPSALYAMRYIATAPMGRLYSFRVEPEVLLELEQIIHLYTARNTDRKFKSLQILEVMK